LRLACSMKMKFILITLVSLAASGLTSAATNDVSTLVERGLFEEEANHQLDAAIGDYKEAIEHFDHERQLAATAIFRLGECYRKQGRTNEANAQYERIVREFSDQGHLAQLSQGYLPSGSGATPAPATGASTLPPDEEKFLSEIKESVQNSPDLVNQQLGQAVEKGYVSAAAFLLAHGADVNLGLPLLEAAQQGNEAMIRLLLSHGAAVNSVDHDGRTALYFAVQKGFMAVCLTLISNGADVNLRSPIVSAAAKANEAMVQLLLSHGADVNGRDGRMGTALSWAVGNGTLSICHALLAHGADVNAKANNGSTPLFIAVDHGNLAAAEFLITNKAQINATNNIGETPLTTAISHANDDMVKLLLDHQADANQEAACSGGNGISSPLDWAIIFDHPDLVKLLAAHGADVNALDKQGRPPLAHLRSPRSEMGRLIEELLIKAGADVNYNRRRAVWMCGVGGTPKIDLFRCPTNSINRYTLLEAVAELYQVPRGPSAILNKLNGQYTFGRYAHGENIIPFPYFDRVAIQRLDGTRAETLHVNVAEIFQSGDCSKDVPLQPGDMVEIAKQEHKVADKWPGLSDSELAVLNKCLLRTVQVIAQGHTNVIALVPCIAGEHEAIQYFDELPVDILDVHTAWLAEALKGRKADNVVRSFLLNKVLRDENVLLNTWDLSRVRLTRGATKMTFDLTANPPPDVWLEDEDVIEISELGESAPTAETK
jgi:ankyrin repeat protein